ncbi:uncharacterized protein LOC142332137 isoform X2 [Lycorma delicatula]|uniref:uncharacterized protein LOC142332137 isoform X2 n=1 Tax=Lycorma delicatula TaxID=130591 RepID=UPI003F51AAF9
MCSCGCVVIQLFLIFTVTINILRLVSSQKIIFPEILDPVQIDYGQEKNDKSIDASGEKNKENDEIPIDVLKKLNSIEDITQLYEEFHIKNSSNSGKTKHSSIGVYDRNGDGVEDPITFTDASILNVERSAQRIRAKPASCIPELQTIKLYKSEDRTTVGFPSCTRVERCGGCCQPEEIFNCRPTESEILNYEVHIFKYSQGRFQSVGKQTVPIERHTKCKCGCIIQEKDCSPVQRYRSENCTCECTNKDAMDKCLSQKNENKYWDPHRCFCQ